MEELRLAVATRPFESLNYDECSLVVACCGYEPRCSHIVQRLATLWDVAPEKIGGKLAVLAFDSYGEAKGRRKAEREFRAFTPKWWRNTGTDDGIAARQFVRDCYAEVGGNGRVLIDYSSMSRMLYLCTLDLCARGISVDYGYSIGDYAGLVHAFPVSSVGEIKGVPGLDGLACSLRNRFYVFGLGLDGVGTLALRERLEAHRYSAFWADAGGWPSAGADTAERNRRLIAGAEATFITDLRDIQGTTEMLRLFAAKSIATERLVLVPVGPKPHVLACGLIAAQFSHVVLLAPHLHGGGLKTPAPPEIAANGEIVMASVTVDRAAVERQGLADTDH